MTLVFIGFCIGVTVGLIFGPDSEREYAARIDGWIDGHDAAQTKSEESQ